MIESVYAENYFGVKSCYDLNVISKSSDKREIIIKTWDGIIKKLKLDEKKKCYIVESEIMEE